MSNGVVKIADLGFSKILTHQNETHTVLGTLYTMAPEVISKQPYGPACDIWSLGIVYYKLLYGSYPYHGSNYAEMLKSLRNKKL
jgi:serine/threonine protein kinase